MPNVYEGGLSAKGLKIAIIVSRFNDFITGRLVDGALDVLKRSDCNEGDISIFKVPGAMEIPPLAKKLADLEKFHGIICLGTVIRGATPHFDYVAAESAKGVAKLGMDSGIPVIYGILTTDTIEQAIERAGTKAGNKGADAALAVIEVANLYKVIENNSSKGVGFSA